VPAFAKISSAEELRLDYRNSTVPPKELFLPRTETVYEFDGQDFLDDALPDEKRVLFAARPCDCLGLALLDKVLDTEDVKEPFYVTRRTNTVVVALGCNRPLTTCFCTTVGGDPFGTEGADVLLGDVGDAFVAEAVTEKGKDFLAEYAKFFSDAGSANWKDQAKHARDSMKSDLDVQDLKARLDDRFENDAWDSVSRQCLGCGTCSCLCPTCYCFDLVDETHGQAMKKIRRWDCCMAASFTLHASGHNPRPVNPARLRQKVMHKFSYYPERYGVNSCVGCGRCVRHCPVHLDIRELLTELTATEITATEN
jgi:ferredoxin